MAKFLRANQMSEADLQTFVRETSRIAKFGMYLDPMKTLNSGKKVYARAYQEVAGGKLKYQKKFQNLIKMARRKLGTDSTFGPMLENIALKTEQIMMGLSEERGTRRAYKMLRQKAKKNLEQGESKQAEPVENPEEYDAKAVKEDAMAQAKKFKSMKQPEAKDERDSRIDIESQNRRLQSPKKKRKPKGKFFLPASDKTLGDIVAREFRANTVEEIYVQLALKYGTTVEQVMKDPRFSPDLVRQFVEKEQKKISDHTYPIAAPGVERDMGIQLDIQEQEEKDQADHEAYLARMRPRARDPGAGGGESKQESSNPGETKGADGPPNNPDNLRGQDRKMRGRHENNHVPVGAGNAGGGETKQGPDDDDFDQPPPNPPPPNMYPNVPPNRPIPRRPGQPPVPPAGGGGGGGGGPPGGGGGGGGAPPAGGGGPAGPGGGGDDEPDDPTDTSVEINRGLPGQPGPSMMPFGSMTSSTAQRVSMERNRMRYSAKKLLMEIRAFVVIYRDDIKTAHFKRLVKTSRTLSVKTPLIRLRKIHRELEEEVIDYYRNQSGLRMGIILDPGAAGLDVTQLQNIMAPHMSFGGAGEVVRELATAADVGKFPETSQKAESVHYHLGGMAHATNAVLPEGKNLDNTFNPAERNRLQNRRTAPIRISAEPKRRYLFQDKRQPFVPRNIKIKSIKC